MSAKRVLCLRHPDWRTLYKAAILETRSTAIKDRVWEAETAVLARAREAFYSGASLEEKEALEDALYILRAYRDAWQRKCVCRQTAATSY